MTKFLYVLSIFSFFLSFHVKADVWEVRNQWNSEWENVFSSWVVKEWDEGIFIRDESPYQGIKTDCADATMGMRAVFSFENGLPFSYRDPSQHGRSINNRIKRWDHLAPIQRFKKFMALVSRTVSTRSLPESSLPVAMNPNSFRPGIFFVKPNDHSYQIKDISDFGIPITMSSTVPYMVRYFDRYEAFPAYNIEDVKTYRDGYRRFLLESELYAPKPQLPGYSLEQFQISQDQDFDQHFTNSVYRERISGGVREPLPDRVNRMMINICNASRNRVDYVAAALKAQSKLVVQGRQCMNAAEYDNYSTNSRDRRFANYFHQLHQLVQTSAFKKMKKTPIMRYAKHLYSGNHSAVTEGEFLEWCSVKYVSGRRISVRQIWNQILEGNIVSNPNASAVQRWGLGAPFRTSCPVY